MRASKIEGANGSEEHAHARGLSRKSLVVAEDEGGPSSGHRLMRQRLLRLRRCGEIGRGARVRC